MNEQDKTPSHGPVGTRTSAGRHVHMGTACSDPTYLPLTPQEQARERALAREAARKTSLQQASGDHRALRHSGRYLQTPKPGHSIFTSQRVRRARRARTAIVLVAAAGAVLALVWFFILR